MSLQDDLERVLGPVKTVEELTAAGVFGDVKTVEDLTADRKTVEELTAMGVFG